MSRWLEVLLSAILLIGLSPVFLIIACLVPIDDGRPIFFGQQRVGRDFRPITVWKFRTMRHGVAETAITVAGDTRITASGKSLRRSKLDELPQLWNVLVGDMSFVGPRPELPEYVELYRQQYQRLLQVRPGITDPASISFRNEEELLATAANPEIEYREKILPAKLAVSEEYLKSRSTANDLMVLLSTFGILLRGNAYKAQ